MRDIDSTLYNTETLKPLMQGAVPQKNTLLGVELELMHVEWSQIWPASVAKSTKPTVVWFFSGIDAQEENKNLDLWWVSDL
jgi:hypothetical protein